MKKILLFLALGVFTAYSLFSQVYDFWCFWHHGDRRELEVEVEYDDEFDGCERWLFCQRFPIFLK